MAKFIYKAKQGPKKIIDGAIEAESRESAVARISKMGYFPISVKREEEFLTPSGGKGLYLFKKPKLRDLAIFTRQLADLLDSGLTLARALHVIHDQTENKYLRSVIADVRGDVEDGKPLSEAAKRHPRIFSKLYVSMIRSGETGGALEGILTRLAEFSETRQEIENKVRSALAYPIVMASVGIITVFVLITFVIPRIVGMFEDLGQALPIPTAILVGISNVIINYWYLILGGLGLVIFSFMKVRKTKEGRFYIDQFKLHLPVFGQLISKSEIARFSRTLGTLLANGVPILTGLDVVAGTMQNACLKRDIDEAYRFVRDGKSLAAGLAKGKYFPMFATNMITVGEEGGQMERALFKVADSYEREMNNAIKIMTSLLEPILIVVMGLIVGFIVISMLLPIFQINIITR